MRCAQAARSCYSSHSGIEFIMLVCHRDGLLLQYSGADYKLYYNIAANRLCGLHLHDSSAVQTNCKLQTVYLQLNENSCLSQASTKHGPTTDGP